jgi:hypothetical protein
MHDIVKYFPYVALAEWRNNDRDNDPSDGSDYILDTLKKWHDNDVCEYTEYFPKPDFSYSFKLKNEYLVVHLGTENKAGWVSNIFGNLCIREGMRSGFRKAGYDTFEKTRHLLNQNTSPVTQLTHSRGVRGVVSSYLAAKRYGKRCRTFLYNPPEVFTRKGKDAYEKLRIPTTSIIGCGDIVSKTGKIQNCVHVGNIVYLPEPDWVIAKIPLIGNHAYSSDFKALMEMCTQNGDAEGYDYLAAKFGEVCKI